MNGSKIYAFGPYILDVRERRLWRDGKPVKMKGKRFDLLVILVENAGHLLTDDEILKKAWPDSNIEENTMANTICRLRKVLGDDSKRPRYIESVEREGYRWVCEVRKVETLSGPSIVDNQRAAMKEWLQQGDPYTEYLNREIAKMASLFDSAAANLRALAPLLAHSPYEVIIMLLNLTDDQKATFFSDMALKENRELTGPKQGASLDALEAAHYPLIHSLDHYHQQGEERELELAVSLGHFWELSGKWQEGRDGLRRALSRPSGDDKLRAKGLAWLGGLLCSLDQYAEAIDALQEGLRIGKEIGDAEAMAIALDWMAVVSEMQGRYGEAKVHLSECLSAAAKDGSKWLEASAFYGFGRVAEAEGKYAEAKEYHSKYLRISEEIGDVRGIGSATNSLGVVARHRGDYEEARKCHEKSLPLRAGIRHKWGMADCYFKMGLVEESAGMSREAAGFFRQSLALHREIGNRLGSAKAMEGGGRAAAAVGEERQAARLLGASQAIRLAIAAPFSLAERKSYGEDMVAIGARWPREWKDGQNRPEEIEV